MDLTTKNKDFTPDEKVAATLSATAVMVNYMGSAKKQNKRIKLLIIFDIILLSSLIGFLIYQAKNPSSTEIDRRWIVQQQNNVKEQREGLKSREALLKLREISIKAQESHDSAATVKNTSDALINLKATEAIAKERADISLARTQIKDMQENSIKRDSLFNQKKIFNVKTVNTKSVNTVNAKSVNIQKK